MSTCYLEGVFRGKTATDEFKEGYINLILLYEYLKHHEYLKHIDTCVESVKVSKLLVGGKFPKLRSLS